MIIYGEYLFLQNYVITFLIMMLTGKLVGIMPKTYRLFIGALWGGTSSFIIFVPMTGTLSILVRLTLGVTCVLVTFGHKSIIKISTIYYILSITSGGTVMALFLWMQKPVISHQGVFYMENITYFKLLSIGILAFSITYWFVKFVRTKHLQTNFYGNACVVVDNKSYHFTAFVDSGNGLIEPISGNPVVLIDLKGASKLPFKAKDIPERYGVIPYRVVGKKHGSLDGVRSDEIIYERRSIKGAYIAFYEGVFGDYEVLMHRDFLEGGLLQNEY